MQEIFKIEDYMDKTFVTLKSDMDVYEAIRILLDKRVTSAMVVDEKNTVVGILSEKDCLLLMRNGSYYELPSGKVKDFMTRDVFCIRPYTDVFKVADIFLDNFFRRIIITDEHKKVLGQITRRDLLRIIMELHKNQGKKDKKIAPIL